MSNYFYFNEKCEYPKDRFCRPSELYPEYLFKNAGISNEKNDVYEMIRNMFIALELDKDNLGTEKWNPLGRYIKRGQTVLIKPNLVTDKNGAEKNRRKAMECLITHPSVVKCILDYVLIALDGTGGVIVGDAPIQDCDFKRLKRISGYQALEDFYKQNFSEHFTIKDFRKIILTEKQGKKIQSENKEMEFSTQIVNLSKQSYFYGKNYEKILRITNYDAKDTNQHHCRDVQEYCLNSACLVADVIISIPKPKTHRLAGYTGALKNFVGINARKEYLPHHRKGEKKKGGDEYPVRDSVKRFSSQLDDWKNRAYKKNYEFAASFITNINALIMKRHRDRTRYGMWYGNDTIWRTILDLNRIINYCDNEGNIRDTRQRKILYLGDMIVCGEKEGPLSPSYKRIGGFLFADNAVVFDLCLVKLMGYDYLKIPTLKNAMRDKMLYDGETVFLHSNQPEYCGGINHKMKHFEFEPTSGWRGHIEVI